MRLPYYCNKRQKACCHIAPTPLSKCRLNLPFAEALKAIKQNARKGFNETVDICVQLGIDPKRSDQAVSLPGSP